ncbi:hypothetical protein ACEUZ9_004055 [Paracoccus litorisediminis]|uniref:hypothetical protein n=1 Tax=Paracoccus litorisediminis TaxID=2006130 RepID=UPI003733B876
MGKVRLADSHREPSKRELDRLMRETHEGAIVKRAAAMSRFRTDLFQQISEAKTRSRKTLKVREGALD